MSDEASGRKVDRELANRLDTLFEDDTVGPDSSGGETDDLLAELKSLAMSIEWEITDDLMGRFVSQVEMLKERYKGDRILVMFLQLLGSLGLYIKSNKGNAHPTAFGLLNSVYTSFASAVVPGKISSSAKKKLLYVELNKYKELKEQIGYSREATNEIPLKKGHAREVHDRVGSKSVNPDENGERPSDAAADGRPPSVTPQEFDAVIANIKQLIRDEFKMLREALAQEHRK